MTFMLRAIPEPAIFERFAERYAKLDPVATEVFVRVGSDYLDYLDTLLTRHGLAHGRWITLILLMREPDRTASPSVLAEKQGVSRPTMTGLLDGLEREGLVTRVSDGRDGRRSLARLTGAGIALLDKVMPEYYAAVVRLMKPIPRARLRILLELLREVPVP